MKMYMRWLPLALFTTIAAAATAAGLALDFIRDLGARALWLAQWDWILALAGAFLTLRIAATVLPGKAVRPWLRFATTTLPGFILLVGAGVLGLMDLRRENHAEVYRVHFKKQGELMERVVAMPDDFRGRVALQWLRSHVAGATVVGADRTLRLAGLAPHRLAGLARVDVKLVLLEPLLPQRLRTRAAQAGLVRINPVAKEPEVWIEPSPSSGLPPAWCAIRWGTGVLLVRAERVEECGE